jgi:uncharacterized protein YacL (UPF0231 family)
MQTLKKKKDGNKNEKDLEFYSESSAVLCGRQGRLDG